MNDLLDDQSLDVKTDVSRGRHKNVTDDLMADVNHVNRNYAPHDQNLVAKTDVSRVLHMNDRLGDHSMDDGHRGALVGHRTNGMGGRNDLTMVGSSDVSLCHRMNDQLGDRNLDGSRVNRNYDLHDRMTGVSLGVKNLHVK
jgi:hypothetical protein